MKIVTGLEEIVLEKSIKVYNLEVEDFHTYFVSKENIWVQNGTVAQPVKNQELLNKFHEVEPVKWQKVYKDGFDAAGNKVSVHYFQSPSGKVFDVDVKHKWSNEKIKKGRG